MMFVSCSTIGGIRSSSPDEYFLADQIRTLVTVERAGYRYVEMYFDNRPHWVSDTIGAALDRLRLEPYSLHLPKFLFTYETERFERTVTAAFSFVEEYGISVAVLHPPNEQQLLTDRWESMFETMLVLAEEAGCFLTLEIIPYLDAPEVFIAETLESYNGRRVGVTLDIEYMHLKGLKITQLFDMFGDKILNTHFRDSDGSLLDAYGKRKYLVPGDGEVDLAEVIEGLKSCNYDWAVTVEVSHKQDENIFRAKQFLDDLVS